MSYELVARWNKGQQGSEFQINICLSLKLNNNKNIFFLNSNLTKDLLILMVKYDSLRYKEFRVLKAEEPLSASLISKAEQPSHCWRKETIRLTLEAVLSGC